MESRHRLDIRHAMHEFGTVSGATQEVRVNRLEDRHTPLIPFPHRHDFYHLVVVSSGTGWHEIDFRRFQIQPHQVFFMKPGQVHSWKMDPAVKGFVVEFGSEAIFEDQRNHSLSPSLIKLPDQLDLSSISQIHWDTCTSLLTLMLDEYELQRSHFETCLRNYLIPLLVTLSRGISNQQAALPRKEDSLLDQFLALVEEHFKSQHEVAFYAKKMHTSSKAITMRVSRALGKSARAMIQERCILEGKRLLAYSNIPISEVGYKIGFEDPSYFSRFFKTTTGLSPGAFRSQVRDLSHREKQEDLKKSGSLS
jgi:AraC-like DNA-binding protein